MKIKYLPYKKIKKIYRSLLRLESLENKRDNYRDRSEERRNRQGKLIIHQNEDDNQLNHKPKSQYHRNVNRWNDIEQNKEIDISSNKISRQNIGRKILENMGWRENQGIGKYNQGIKEPIQLIQNPGREGLR